MQSKHKWGGTYPLPGAPLLVLSAPLLPHLLLLLLQGTLLSLLARLSGPRLLLATLHVAIVQTKRRRGRPTTAACECWRHVARGKLVHALMVRACGDTQPVPPPRAANIAPSHIHGWRSWNCACGQHVCLTGSLPTNPQRGTRVPWPQPPRPLAQPDASQRPPQPWPVPPPPPPYVALRPPGPLAAAELEKPHTKHNAVSSQGLRRRRNRKDMQKIAVCVNFNQPTLPPHLFPLPNPMLYLGIPCALVKLME